MPPDKCFICFFFFSLFFFLSRYHFSLFASLRVSRRGRHALSHVAYSDRTRVREKSCSCGLPQRPIKTWGVFFVLNRSKSKRAAVMRAGAACRDRRDTGFDCSRPTVSNQKAKPNGSATNIASDTNKTKRRRRRERRRQDAGHPILVAKATGTVVKMP